MSHVHIPAQRTCRETSPVHAETDALALVNTFRQLRELAGHAHTDESDLRCIAAAKRLNNDLTGVLGLDQLWHRSRVERCLDDWLHQDVARTRMHWALLARYGA